MESFTYSPIDLEGPTSRLLQLHAGTESSKITCTLFDAWLDPNIVIPYEALSYTWGDTRKTNAIEVNGRSLGITANLHVALQHLRLDDEDRIMWIDAVCINQDNVEERGHHVKQMARIYQLAERVVIWLGPSTTGSDLLMDCMQGLQRMSIDYACHDWKASDPRWQQMWSEVRLWTEKQKRKLWSLFSLGSGLEEFGSCKKSRLRGRQWWFVVRWQCRPASSPSF
jgi:hypothetical protein